MKRALMMLAFTAPIALAACGDPSTDADGTEAVSQSEMRGTRPAPAPSVPLVPPGEEADVPPLTPAGFGAYQVGQPLPGSPSHPNEVGKSKDGKCHLFRDQTLPGVSVLTDGAVVVRVSAQAPSKITTGAGIGVGSREAELRAVYPDLRAAGADGGDLYTSAADADGLRFQIGRKGEVVAMHGGRPPYLGQADTCP